MASSETEFKAEMRRLIRETERKVEDLRHEHPHDIANYDATEENRLLEQGKYALLPVMRSKPLEAFELLFEMLHQRGYRHFYLTQIAEYFITYTHPLPQEITSFLKTHLFEGEFLFLKQLSLEFFEYALQHYPDKDLQAELMGLLLDDDPTIRLTSVRIFARHQDEQAIPFLSLLLEDEHLPVRQKAHLALAQFKNPAARIALDEWAKRNGKS